MVRNLLNDTRALTFKLQATICREVDFQILSPLPISLGSFPLSTAGQGFVKLLNPTARDLSYTVSAQNVELLLGDPFSNPPNSSRIPQGTQFGTQSKEGVEVPARGYEACVEVRRARVTSSALRPDEREHLESSVGPFSAIPEIEGKTSARYPRVQTQRTASRSGSPRKTIGERIPHRIRFLLDRKAAQRRAFGAKRSSHFIGRSV